MRVAALAQHRGGVTGDPAAGARQGEVSQQLPMPRIPGHRVGSISQHQARGKHLADETHVVPADPLTQLEAVAVLTTALFREDESFYRGAFIAAEFAEDQSLFWSPEAGIVQRALAFPIHAFQTATTAGLMRGRVAPAVLIQQIFEGYRTTLRDWAVRLITLEQYRVLTLRSFYCGMAVDAVDSLRDELVARLVALPAG